jgi:hypothetical protein
MRFSYQEGRVDHEIMRFSYQEGRVDHEIPLTGLIPPHFCAWNWISNIIGILRVFTDLGFRALTTKLDPITGKYCLLY